MRKLFFLLVFSLFSQFAMTSNAQNVFIEDVRTDQATVVPKKMEFKPTQQLSDNVEIIELISLGTPTIKISNMADGTKRSYDHALRISYPLVLASGKTGYQLCFYNTPEIMPYTVETKAGITSIYFPVSIHDVIKNRIDQTLAAKKKIAIKLTQLIDGYREAILGGN